jgi:hypothetical protein
MTIDTELYDVRVPACMKQQKIRSYTKMFYLYFLAKHALLTLF